MSDLHNVIVKSIKKTTPDCAIVEFEIDGNLRNAFQYKAGQYLTLEHTINDEVVRRCYSLCSSPNDDCWKIGVKKIENGKFSTFVNEVLEPGDLIKVMPPDGHFHIPIEPNKSRKYVAFAAGSGITPIFSLIKTHLEEELKSSFKLFYINKNLPSIILREEIEALKNRFMNRFEVFHFFTRQNRAIDFFNGRLNEEKLAHIFNTFCNADVIDHYFSCGPETMIKLIESFLLDKGVDKSQIHYELFGTNAVETEEKKAAIQAQFKGEACAITVLEGGKEITFTTEKGCSNILDEALKNAADLPYACKGGVCATCIAKLVKGDVEMLLSYGLEQEQIDEGYILTCQSVPISNEVLVDFDV